MIKWADDLKEKEIAWLAQKLRPIMHILTEFELKQLWSSYLSFQ